MSKKFDMEAVADLIRAHEDQTASLNKITKAVADACQAAEQQQLYFQRTVYYATKPLEAQQRIRNEIFHELGHLNLKEFGAAKVLYPQGSLPLDVTPAETDALESFVSEPTPEGSVVIEVPVGELSAKGSLSISGIAKLTAAIKDEPTTPAVKPPVVCLAPAASFTEFAQSWLSPEAYRLYIEPAIADMYLEHYRHLKNGDEKAAKRTLVRCYVRIAWPFVRALWKGFVGLFIAAR